MNLRFAIVALVTACGSTPQFATDAPQPNDIDAANADAGSTEPLRLKLDAGDGHACVLTTAGTVLCWGGRIGGHVGGGVDGDNIIPFQMEGLQDIRAIGSGSHICVVTQSGGAKCWGKNSSGELGDNTITHRALPVDVVGLGQEITAITPALAHTCALTTVGGVKCWGANEYGQLGNNSKIPSLTPVDVVGLGGQVAALSAAGYRTCVVLRSGGAQCWGMNINGGLGNNSTIDSAVPVDVVGLTTNVSAISVGTGHACALTTAGGVKCWGYNDEGQLGNPGSHSKVPVDVTGLTSGCVAVAASIGFSSNTCALTSAGGMKCWGLNEFGELGNNSAEKSNVPVDVIGLTSGVASIAVGSGSSCAVTVEQRPFCWGHNSVGQLGVNSLVDIIRVPTPVYGF
jgi:alpha-tubulin suppressor-like RCC1 family protein